MSTALWNIFPHLLWKIVLFPFGGEGLDAVYRCGEGAIRSKRRRLLGRSVVRRPGIRGKGIRQPYGLPQSLSAKNRQPDYVVGLRRQRVIRMALLWDATKEPTPLLRRKCGLPGRGNVSKVVASVSGTRSSHAPVSDGPAPGSTQHGKDGPRNRAGTVLLCPPCSDPHQEAL